MGKGALQEITLGLELSQMRCRSCGSTSSTRFHLGAMTFYRCLGLGIFLSYHHFPLSPWATERLYQKSRLAINIKLRFLRGLFFGPKS